MIDIFVANSKDSYYQYSVYTHTQTHTDTQRHRQTHTYRDTHKRAHTQISTSIGEHKILYLPIFLLSVYFRNYVFVLSFHSYTVLTTLYSNARPSTNFFNKKSQKKKTFNI